ncbi:MAG: T9SS type A sorting domain-containing protein [Bacteroidales bacterium]|nr:T9SS type A sorting domain-containing protein [Bacteroidales bacterium]
MMKTFTKLAVSIMLVGVAQQVFSQEMIYKSYRKGDTPFYDGDAVRSFLKRQTAFDTLWLPVSMTETYNNKPDCRCFYEYHENGLLKKETYYSLIDGGLMCIGQYNNTYRDPLMDIPDTLFWTSYGLDNPPFRYYYNNRQADSSYWEEYYQVWDGNKWKTEEKSYVHLLDTATVSEFQDHIEVFDRNGNITQSRKTVLTFDDQGNVIEAVSDCFDLTNGQYKTKHVYLYDTEGVCYNRDQFYTFSGPWLLGGKLTDIKWFEFHGFDNGDLLFHGRPLGLYEGQGYSPKNKNKMSSLKFWNTYEDGTPNLKTIDTMKWNLEPFSCHYLCYYPYRMCLAIEDYYECNEHYHLISEGKLLYAHWDCDTIPYDDLRDEYINKYDDRGRRYEYIQYNTYSSPNYDTLFYATMVYTVDSFTYVVRPVGVEELFADTRGLLIVPNPSDGTVRITAEDDIATITLYATDGRLAYSRDGTGKEMSVNTERLAAGVYVVQVRLRNGGVRTGKLIKN